MTYFSAMLLIMICTSLFVKLADVDSSISSEGALGHCNRVAFSKSTVKLNEPRSHENELIDVMVMFVMYGESGYVKLLPAENSVGLVV